MGRNHRANERADRRRKHGLNADGTHRNRYEGQSSVPGPREKTQAARWEARLRAEKAAKGGTGLSWLTGGGRGTSSYEDRTIVEGEGQMYEVYVLIDEKALAALVVGKELPNEMRGSRRFYLGGNQGFEAIALSGVWMKEQIAPLAQMAGKRVRVTRCDRVGQTVDINPKFAGLYGDCYSQRGHAFRILEDGGYSPLKESVRVDLLERIEPRILGEPPQRARRHGISDGPNYDEPKTHWW